MVLSTEPSQSDQPSAPLNLSDSDSMTQNKDVQHPSATKDVVSVTEAPDWPNYLLNSDADVGKSLFRRLFHWGPLCAMGLTMIIGMTSIHVHVLFWPIDDPVHFAHFVLFVVINYAVLYNLVRASFLGGGFVTKGWHPPNVEDQARLQYCAHCNGFKAPRSHHCRKCNRCVMKMDHHCPWINNCVGLRNQSYFFTFLFFAVLGSLHGALILGTALWRTLSFLWRNPSPREILNNHDIIHSGYTFFIVVLAVSFAIGVVLAVGVLLVNQVVVILKNKTGVEDYICTKAEYRERDMSEGPFQFPYDLGWRRNIREVFPSIGAKRPAGNGIWWPVRSDCTQFAFSEEQIAQKANKRLFARIYDIQHDHSGGMFTPLRFGLGTLICQPCSEEARIAVRTGESYAVTRKQRNWLYGQRLLDRRAEDDIQGPFAANPYAARASRDQRTQEVVDQAKEPRGWFPKQLAVARNARRDEDKKDQ